MKKSKTAYAVLPSGLQTQIDSLEIDILKKHLQKARNKFKKSAKSKDYGNLPPNTTLQKELIGTLGFTATIDEYRRQHKPDIDRFLHYHGMTKKANLVTLRLLTPTSTEISENHSRWDYGGIDFELSRQDISERLFYSNLPLPNKLFTGYDFDYWSSWEDGITILDLVAPIDSNQSSLFKPYLDGLDAMNKNIQIARKHNSKDIYFEHPNHSNRKAIDVVLSGYPHELATCFNLLGDMLVTSIEDNKKWQLNHAIPNDKFGPETAPISQLLHYRIHNQPKGWVEVIRYNDNLIFLKAKNGKYDFVFRNQRDFTFNTKVYGENNPAKHVPAGIPDYKFEHWYYFKHKGWKAMEKQLAHSPTDLAPTIGNAVEPERRKLIEYYSQTGDFQFEQKYSDTPLQGFKRIDLGGKELAISDLVTIDYFMDWFDKLDGNSLPSDDDRLKTVNPKMSDTLPATTTLRAARCYIRDLENKSGIHLRMLKEEEYRTIRRGEFESKEDVDDGRLLEFVAPDGHKYDRHPPYMPKPEFQNLFFQFSRKPNWIKYGNGLSFVDSDEIAELLYEGTCILSKNLVDLSSRQSGKPLRPVAEGSTGKYKSVKFVFRICHELKTQ